MSIVLAANKESLLIDPINWERLYGRLVEWSTDHITIPKITDDLFRERETCIIPRALSQNNRKMSFYLLTQLLIFMMLSPH